MYETIPIEKFRAGTSDEVIFRSVSENNEYLLPDFLNSNDIIIDIGGHIGAFTYACLSRGARRIYCYEALEENYNIAKTILEDGINKEYVKLIPLAVWRSDRPPEVLRYTKGGPSSNASSGTVVWEGTETYPPILKELRTDISINTIAFDSIIKSLERVKLVKMDCEGSEYPILLTSKQLNKIDYICGEFHVTHFGVGRSAMVNGKSHFGKKDLEVCLDENGFSTLFIDKASDLGLFFAKKKGAQNFFKEISINDKKKHFIWLRKLISKFSTTHNKGSIQANYSLKQ